MSTKTDRCADSIGEIEEFLRQCLEEMEPDRRLQGPGRPRILPAMALWAGLLVCVLRGFSSQLAVWRLISEARDLAAELPAGTLLVADLGYFGFAWFDWLSDRGYHWLSRLRAKTSYEVVHVFHQRGEVFDGIVWLGAYRADRAKHAVRLVTFRQGKTMHRYITNVRDPHTFPIRSIAEVYARRWDIEMALKLVKQHLKLHLLWSSKQVVILQQIWATLIISQVLQALRLEIAYKAGVDPFDVSIGLLVQYAPQYGYEGRDPVKIFVERGRDLGFIRPSRRTRIHAPTIPDEAILPAPPSLSLTRTPRYANRNVTGPSKRLKSQ